MKSILIIKNDGIGDLICSSGLISRLSEKYSGNVDLITCIENKEVAEHIPNIGKIFYVSRDALSTCQKSIPVYAKIPFLKKFFIPYSNHVLDYRTLCHLLVSKYDVAVSLRRFIRTSTAILMAMVRADKKYSCWQYPKNLTFQAMKSFSEGYENIVPTQERIWEPSYYQLVLEQIFGKKFIQDPYLRLPEPLDAECEIHSGSIGLIISDRGARSWPDEYWSNLLDWLLSLRREIYLFGSAGDRKAWREKYRTEPLIHDVCGKLEFLGHHRYFRRLSLIIGEDTGLAHLAPLSGVPLGILQANRDPRCFFPWTTVESVNLFGLYYSMPCHSCFLRPAHACVMPKKKRSRCIEQLSPESVRPYIEKALSGAKMPNFIDVNDGWKTHF
ncbi:MAG: hypothetical protein LBC40_06730 [Dysgonamonadaceae bacterium]|jgi:ADP-heptose:LPS heptosyltransferase|nr:hypothetical protein [Dysgonamonadaceae bacterium]